jgi:hypothetical protein
MRVQGGYHLYGFSVGVLMLDTQFPRIPGDMGNATTFPFPVRYHRVPGASPELVVRQGSRALLPAFIEGAKSLVRDGVQAITTNCGLLAKFQRELAASVAVPVFTSSLLLVPMVHRMLPPGKVVGVLSVDASALTADDFTAGLETEREFTRVLLGNQLTLDVDAARREHIRVAQRLCAEHPAVGALVLECTNMPPYRGDIQAATGLAVFDIVHLVQMVHTALGHGIPPRPVG